MTHTDQSRELLPCPFCGGEARIKTVAQDWWKIILDHDDECPLAGHYDDAIVPQDDESKAWLMSRWNRRATTEESSGVELPEPVASTFTMEALIPGGRRSTHFTPLRQLPAGTKLYTEQQVRALLAAQAAPAVLTAKEDAINELMELVRQAMDSAMHAGESILDTEGIFERLFHKAEQRRVAVKLKLRALLAGVKDGLTAATGVTCTCPSGDGSLHWPCPKHPQGWLPGQSITEEMHVAACKVLTRANGLDGTPQRMLDAMLAAAPQPPKEQPVSLKWCTTCGEGAIDFCRGASGACPLGLKPPKEQT